MTRSGPRLTTVLAAAACLVVSLPTAAELSGARTERLSFASQDVYSFADLFAAKSPVPTIAVEGELTLPRSGGAKLPAMVIVHGHSGVQIGGREAYWANVLLNLGIATFVIDSYAPRGVESATSDPAVVTGEMMTVDALSALGALASHARIDPDRIGVLGFSEGGFAAINAAITSVWEAVTAGQNRFVLHLAFYPPCNAQWYTATTTGAPIGFLLAERDDLSLARHCQNYAERIAAAGGAVLTATFPGVHHGFDSDLSVAHRSSVFNRSKCMYRIDDRGELIDVNHSMALTTPERRRHSLQKCGYYGATTGGNEGARSAATRKVREYVSDILLRR